MELTLDLPAGNVEFLDQYAKAHHCESRSAVVRVAIRALRSALLGDDYEGTWSDWFDSEDAGSWDSTTYDGVASD